MILAAVFVYVLAGITIGRTLYELDVYAGSTPRYETLSCVLAGVFWPAIPARGLAAHFVTPRIPIEDEP